MNEDVHRYLDGDVPRSALPIPEQRALRETDDAIAAVRSWVRGHDVPDLASRVMAALPEESFDITGLADTDSAEATQGPVVGAAVEGRATQVQPAVSRPPLVTRLLEGLRWIWTPRPIAVRPAMAGAFILALIIAFGRPGQTPPSRAALTSEMSPATAPVYIQFRLDTPNASNVALAGTFTEWQPAYSLYESAPGVWTVTVPLEPGVHDYLFIVDGERWVPDPAAPPVDDGFGGTNSRLLLTAPQLEA